ncbi:hypothetical protein AALP_AA6G187300 [Arabis alpina]|uniref:Uncharacterized protein n=1 Tax=Arabis alpina TaxID=50452 RepID=A0A087GQ50_ARAAL|nr:hypothetical protein AALP_AA6G187300 [Arabis alpina]
MTSKRQEQEEIIALVARLCPEPFLSSFISFIFTHFHKIQSFLLNSGRTKTKPWNENNVVTFSLGIDWTSSTTHEIRLGSSLLPISPPSTVHLCQKHKHNSIYLSLIAVLNLPTTNLHQGCFQIVIPTACSSSLLLLRLGFEGSSNQQTGQEF